MGKIELNPQRFVEVVLLGMYWQHWPPKVHHSSRGVPYTRTGASTVDHVLNTLLRIKVIDESVVDTIRHKTKGVVYQRTLLRHCGIYYGSAYVTDKYSMFVCQQASRGATINLQKLVRDQRLEIISAGAEKALALETKYTASLSRDNYLAEVERYDALFTNEATAASSSALYRQRVQRDLNE